MPKKDVHRLKVTALNIFGLFKLLIHRYVACMFMERKYFAEYVAIQATERFIHVVLSI